MNTVTLQRSNIRPSALDKLKECSYFLNDPKGNEATERGTKMDDLFRESFRTEPQSVDLPESDKKNVEWAVQYTMELANDCLVITGKQLCKVSITGFPDLGEVDALIAGKYMHVDLKSGQRRSYLRQQAAYALGLMDAYFTDSWTVFILFCDLQEVERLYFTYETAKEIIRLALEEYENPTPPRANDYCEWCAQFEKCPVPRSLAANSFKVPEGSIDFEAILTQPDQLGLFLDGCAAIESFDKRGRKHALALELKGQTGATGYQVANRGVTMFIKKSSRKSTK